MKRLLFFLMAIVFAIQGWTQVVTIGSGTTGVYTIPVNTFYNHSYTQQIFTASEIGTQVGVINSISFQYFYGTAQTKDPVTIYLGNTTKSTFASTSDWVPVSAMDNVFTGSVTFNNSGTNNWVNIEFDSPFIWDGTSNIVVAVLNNNGSYSTSSNSTFYTHTASGNYTLRYQVDGSTPIDPVTGSYIGTLTTDRNNIQFEFGTPPTCPKPGMLTYDNNTPNSIDITWVENGTATLWEMEYKLASEADWTNAISLPAYSTTTTITNLTANTLYDVRVKAICSLGDESTWREGSFRTDCDLINTLPFEESFDTYGTGSGTFLTCWGKITSNTYPYISTTNSSSPGSMYMYTASGAYNYIVTPEFDVSIPINSLSAFFKLYKTGAAYNITVGVMSDPTDATTFDSITNLSPTSTSTWQIFGVDFTNYTGIGQHIAFKVQGYGATNSMYIDDLMINTTPSCSIPTGLTDYDSLATPNSITLDWDGADDANVVSWIVEYKPIDATTWQSEDAFAHPFVLTGLQSSVVYQVRLYAICSSGDTTYATNTINVGMPCEAITTIPWNEGFEGVWFVAYGLNTGTHPWCWTNINGGTQASGVWRKTTTSSYVHSGTGALQMYSGSTSAGLSGDWMISPPISLTGNERLRFWAKGYSTYIDDLSVKILDVTTNGVVDAEADTSLFVDIMPNTIIPASNWTEYEVNLNQFTGDYQIAFVRNTTGGYYLNIDDVSITELPNCVRPSDITISSLESNSATISWTPGNTADASWYICYKASTATDYDSVLVNSNPYQLQGLNPQTIYNYYLRTDCGNEFSEATSVYSFTTPCDAVTVFPYTEGFDSLGAAGAFHPCWSRPVIYSTYPKTSTEASRVHSAPASLEIHSAVGSPTYAVTPPMGADINTLRVRFWAMAESITSSGTIEVGVMSDPSNLLTFESVQTIQPTNTSYNQYEVLFSGTTLTGMNRFIAFRQNTVSAIYYYWIDDIEVDYIPACSHPASVVASNITTTGADITWAPANATDNAWWLYYKTAAATSYDSIYITGTPSYSFTTLSPNTLYNIYLTTDCGTELSEPTAITNFRTACAAISTLPFAENFDSYGTGTSIMPSCWVRTTTYADRPYVNTGGRNSTNCLYFYAGTAGTYNFAVMPPIDINTIPINTLKMKFYYKNSNSSDMLVIGAMSDPTLASTFDSITTIIAPTTGTWAEYEVNLSTYTGTNQYLAFKNAYTTTGAYAYIDDLIIDIIPSCESPDSLYASNVTQTDANINFTPATTSDTQWKLYYRAVGASSWTDVDVFAIPHQLTSLTANTAYEVYVTTLCGDATYSDASTILTFRTPCDNVLTIPYTENFDTYGTGTAATSYPTCWSRNVTTYATANYPYISTTNFSTPGAMYFYAYNNTRTVAVCHPIDATIPINTLMVEFKMRYSTIYPNGIQVGVMTDPNDFNTFVPVGAAQNISAINVWEDKAVLLTDYVGTGQYIALAAIAPASGYSISYVDNFKIDLTPNCPNVYGLAVGVASTTSVNVNWDNSGDLGDGFNIAYSSNLTTPFDPTTATIIPIPTGTTLPYIIPGFNPGDSVWAAVQRGCNGTWTDAQKVTLPQSAITLPYSQNFEDTLLVSEWTFTSSNATMTDKWFIGAATGNPGNSMYVSSNGGVTNSYTQVSTYNYATALVEFGQAAEFGLTFDWKGVGESCCDKFSVYLLPMSAPMPTTGYPVGGTTLLAPINQQSTWQTKNIILPSATFANSIQRLVFVWYSDVSSITDPPAAVDNITITSTDCGTPTTLAASNILTTSADVTWTEVGTATSWYLYYKPASSTTYDSILVSTTPTYSFTNLIANTAYNIYVVADCGTQFSNYSNVVNFRTACDAISTLPYSENFEGYGTGTSIMPACWVRTTTYADRPYVNSGGYSGNCLYFYAGTAGTYNIAAMNPIDASIPINTLMATFYYKNYASTDRLIVGVMTDPTNASTFDSITTIAAPSTATWAEYEVNFSSYTGTGTYIAFKNIYTTTYGYAYLDNLVVDIIPSCARPTALSVTGTGTSMDVSFTPGNTTDNAWYVYYKPATATDWDSVYTATIPTNIPGLILQTTYQIYAKTVCSDGTNSNASQTITYTTPCSSGAISSFPWTEGFEGGLTCWQQEFVIGTTSWTTTSSNNASHTGTGFANFYETSGNKTKLVSPLLDISALSQPYVSFYHMQEVWVSDQDELKVFYRTSSTGTWTQLVHYTSSIAAYQFDSIALPSPSSTYQLAFEGFGDYGYGVALDDITVYDANSTPCPQPTNVVVTPSNISATVTWSAGAESAWEVRLGETGTPTALSTTNYTIPGLTAGTPYTVYVRSNCGTGYSAWVSVQFTTTTAPTPPSVSTTVPTTQITQTTAVFNGAYLQGSDTIQSKGFEYKKTTDASWTDQVVIDGTTPFTYTATNLSASTEYKVKSYVTTATDGRVFGDTITFTTLAIIPPTVTTDSVRNVSQTSATFYGTITANTEQIEARGFEYKLSTEAWADAIIISATGVTNIYASPTTLQDGRTYNVRAYGRTLSDTSYGQTLTFSTLTAPTVTTTPTQPADVQSTSATLKGTVTSAGNALPSQVVVGFVYSTTTNPVIGATGVLQAEATYSTTDPNFTTQITELASNTNYFFKAYITNPVTTAYGNEANFITLGLLGVDGKEISIMMYPNPATSQTNLIVEGVSGETKIVLSDVQGRILNTINTKAVNGVVEQTIDLNNLAKGVYYIRIQNSYINRTQKLIVK